MPCTRAHHRRVVLFFGASAVVQILTKKPALLMIAGLYCVLYTAKSGVAGPVGFVLSLSVSIFAIFMLAELSGFDWDLALICLWAMIGNFWMLAYTGYTLASPGGSA
mmetsp:Transcript_21678/g.35746  ORF Transcript_21678/g.35746 Transcript_21678/m.35746 type:complete len:107 (-) Transcript_21678:274-594(-)